MIVFLGICMFTVLIISVVMMFITLSIDMSREILPKFQLYRRWRGGTWRYDRIYGWRPQHDKPEEENWG